MATADREAALAALRHDLVILADYVEQTSGGDAVKIQSAGMDVRADHTPVGQLAQVGNFSLTMGDNAGEVDGHWDPVRGSKAYELQFCTADPSLAANWHAGKTAGSSKTTVTGQTSGSRVWLRVRAKAPKDENDGPWSQPATVIVP